MTNSQKLKKEILKNLTDLCFDPLGDLVSSKSLMNKTYQNENSYHFRYYSDDKLNPNWRTEPQTNPAELTPADYQEVKEAMINEIFQSPHDWKIEKENDLTVIKHKMGRKHWKSKFSEGFQQGFKENEWKEIENVLSNQEQKDSPSSPENPSIPSNQAQEEQPPKEIKYMGHIYYRGSKY